MTEIKFYNYPILCGKADEVRNYLIEQIENGKKLFIVTLNSQIFLRAEQIPDYMKALRKADFHLPDGAGIVWAIKKHCNIKSDRIPGIDTMDYLCDEAVKRNWTVYLLGAKPDVVKKAADILKKRGVKIVGYHHGYFEDQTPAKEIQKLKPDLLFVGMGAPRQELWIAQHMHLPFKLAMGVGGSFDVIAGVKKRAPVFFQKMRLEWFYRWLTEPISRSRVPVDVMKFYFKVVLDGKAGACKTVHRNID
ncbi:MAG: WecB/TagA/CpsF family glycosyltransferase [Fervidobacterium sp.]|uniref:N-acetylmannosaminyltransferase n=1 Tax=Fervidobacterium gondwanense DSM 13020 TaxID=1121883 RepID=A0A1M7RW19_FERGO|nr:WecB/TagA/CpsF family glycosyltransferase [Fervidobacterium gondwanense]UXF00031.1 lipopolysaccharide biosynthesis protein [Fervidobacterium riparium]SHN50430.1 N-acetylmannosaminyltransferase [Fervidobacterium gondwanense DSM 13020]